MDSIGCYKPKCNGGGDEIRTHGTVTGTHTFQACALNHSATPPSLINYYTIVWMGWNVRSALKCQLFWE